MKKKLLSILFAAVLVVSSISPAFADEESDLRAQKAQSEEELSGTQEALNELAVRQQQIQSEISDLNRGPFGPDRSGSDQHRRDTGCNRYDTDPDR